MKSREYVWPVPVILKLNWEIPPLMFCTIQICYSMSFVKFCICCRFISMCLWYLRCLFNWPLAIAVFIFVSWKVKLIGDMKWNPIRSDNFRGFQWNVVNKQTQSKHEGELIKFSGEHHKYWKFLICGIVYIIIILSWQLILLVLWSKGKFNEIDRQIKTDPLSTAHTLQLRAAFNRSSARAVR